MKKAFCLILCFIFIFAFSACGDGENQSPDAEQQKGTLTICEGVYISSVTPFSGAFVEDGSDENVSNVMSVTIVNESEKSYQLFDFSLTTGDEEYNFSTRTLLSGSSLTVLEKDRKSMPADISSLSPQLTDISSFETIPLLHEDIFEISGAESIINVRNLSDSDKENVVLYYKGVNAEGFFGGITYRVEIGTVPAGEIIQVVASKYSPEKTKAVFVTYDA